MYYYRFMHININIGVGTRGEGAFSPPTSKVWGRGMKFIFLPLHRNTPAKAFLNMGPKHAQLLNWKGNSTFILVIIKLCDMLNIKSYGISDPRLVWMEKFVSWLHCWNRYNVQHDSGFLSKEIYNIQSHCQHICYTHQRAAAT